MPKLLFLKNLEDALKDCDIPRAERTEILEDYAQMIEEATVHGDVEAFIERLGSPKSMARTFAKDMPRKKQRSEKWVAVSPFIALIIFFYAGFAHDAWHPAWLAFLLIPVIAILSERNALLETLTALSVFVVLSVFMIVGTYWGLWHPFWALFLLIAGIAFLQGRHWLHKLFGLYTFAVVVGFILYVLLIEPMHDFVLLVFLPIPIMGLLSSELDGLFRQKSRQALRRFLGFALFAIGLLVIYLYLGINAGLWHPGWLLFMLIPIAGLLHTQWVEKVSVEPVAYTPFIAVILFFLWGEYGNAYAYSWLVFLMIPITAILFSKD